MLTPSNWVTLANDLTFLCLPFLISKKEIIGPADDHYKNQIISEFKDSESYKKLEQNNINLENQVNFLNNQLLQTEENAINKFKSSKDYELLIANANNYQKLEARIEEIKKQAVNDFKLGEEFTKLESHNKELQNDLMNLENKLKDQDRNSKAEIILEYKNSEEYRQLQNQIDQLKQEKITLETSFKTKEDLLYYAHLEKFRKEPEFVELQQERDTLKEQLNSRRYKNSKLLGEDLEEECQKLFENDFQQTNDVKFVKTTKPINGNKPDFEFTVYSNEEKTNKLGSIILEMKNNNGEDKTKNSSFLEKLERDRINFHADFALLVTELESNDNFTIKKAVGYSNIFLVRPDQFVYVLVLFRLIYLNLGKAVDNLSKERLDKEEIDKIVKEFDDFKNDLFSKSLEKIENNIQKIIKLSDDIKKKSEEIISSAEVIKNTHLETVKNKVTDFNKKIGN